MLQFTLQCYAELQRPSRCVTHALYFKGCVCVLSFKRIDLICVLRLGSVTK